MKLKLALLVFVLFAVHNHFFIKSWSDRNVIISDPAGYYMYLAGVAKGDIVRLQFLEDIQVRHHPWGDLRWSSIYTDTATNKRLIKYPYGVSLFESPFFFAAHIYTRFGHNVNGDVFARPYQIAVILSALFWGTIGLSLLSRFLRKMYSDNVVLIVIILVSLGTNLYHYTVYEPGMSHVYSFFLGSAGLYFTNQLYENPARYRYFIFMGLVMGLFLVTRPTDALFLLIPLLWGIKDVQGIKERIKFFTSNYLRIFIALLVALFLVFWQLLYWRAVTGNWVSYSYQSEGFNFLHPKIWKGLFSYRKGWFIYTPVAFIGILGLYFLWRRNKGLVMPLVIYLTAMSYVVFSWWMWYYGGSFGCRALIAVLPVVSIPLAALVERVIEIRTFSIKMVFAAVFLFFIVLNIFQSYQYYNAVIHWDRMSRAYYWRVFGKMEVSAEDQELLMSEYDYWHDKDIGWGN